MKVIGLTNLFVGYNKQEDFRVLICASDENEAKLISEEYCEESGMKGEFELSEFDDVNIQFDCDYVLTNSWLKMLFMMYHSHQSIDKRRM